MANPDWTAAPRGEMEFTLVYSPAARQVREWTLKLSAATTVAQALAASGIFEEFPELLKEIESIGVWGSKTSSGSALNPHDRIEIYRTLRVDPKVARRERFNSQGAKRAGLFSKTRPGAKAGY